MKNFDIVKHKKTKKIGTIVSEYPKTFEVEFDDGVKTMNENELQISGVLPHFLINIYSKVINLSRENNQVVGENNDYYITLEQLEALFKEWKAEQE